MAEFHLKLFEEAMQNVRNWQQSIDRTRKSLLLAATIGSVMALTNIVPKEIKAFEISFSNLHQKYMFIIVGLIVLYLTFKFILVFIELAGQKNSLAQVGYKLNIEMESANLSDEDRRLLRQTFDNFSNRKNFGKIKDMFMSTHDVFENALPILIGISSIIICVCKIIIIS